jgi:hypothetical protein
MQGKAIRRQLVFARQVASRRNAILELRKAVEHLASFCQNAICKIIFLILFRTGVKILSFPFFARRRFGANAPISDGKHAVHQKRANGLSCQWKFQSLREVAETVMA